ncbi:MAG: GGDEF domain-containing protein [Desulfotomaculales bacterium]
MNVGDIMTQPLVTITADQPVRQAVDVMDQLRIGCLPVVEKGRLAGIITSRDVRGVHPNRLVADAMKRDVVTVALESSLWEAKELLDRHGIERLVVVYQNRPVGILTKARLNAEIGKHIDSLTGLNRAEFLQRKAWELLAQGREIAVVFLDLDDFGRINKEFGHVFGDRILALAADVLKGLVENGVDHLCRYAGDELAIVTTRPLEEAARFAARLVDALATYHWPGGIAVTASAGVAGGRRRTGRGDGNEACTVSDLINLASLASTTAKRKKRPVVTAGKVEFTEAS